MCLALLAERVNVVLGYFSSHGTFSLHPELNHNTNPGPNSAMAVTCLKIKGREMNYPVPLKATVRKYVYFLIAVHCKIGSSAGYSRFLVLCH